MKVFTAAQVAEALPYAGLAEALNAAFAEGVTAPPRHVHKTSDKDLFMLMPAWTKRWTGLKVLTLIADNPSRNMPFIQGNYLLMDSVTGEFLASMDGTELTRRRTAAASAMASGYLSRQDSATHLIVGAGSLALHFAEAHRAMRPIKRTLIFNRTMAKAQEIAAKLPNAEAVSDLESAVRNADIISGITSSTSPLIRGEWLKPGQHLDLAGAYRSEMRETDAEAVRRSRVYVDTLEGAGHEAGDLLQAESEGAFSMSAIAGELADLATGRVKGRGSDKEITLFKSCGTAIEDLAAAAQVYLHHR